MALLSNYLKTTFTATTPSPLSSGNYIVGDDFNGALPVTWSVDATPTNTASTIVARDGSGNFIANKATINLDVYDTRGVQTGPSLGSKQARFDFKSNSTDGLSDGGSYHGVLTLQQWNDPTGGGTRQLGFTDNDNLWIRGSGTGLTAYNPWKLLLNSANVGNYALPLTGGTLTGNLTISSTGALRVPNGTDAQRPTGELGMVRYSTTSSKLEAYTAAGWTSLATAADAGDPAGTAVAMAIALG